MIREEQVKKAFRVAYETLDQCDEPANTPEYAQKIIKLFSDTWVANNHDGLLKYLSIGIIEWLSDLAREADRK